MPGDRGERRVGSAGAAAVRCRDGGAVRRRSRVLECRERREAHRRTAARREDRLSTHGGILEPLRRMATDSTAFWRKSIAPPTRSSQFTADLVRIPTVNPPGDEYEACARFLGDTCARAQFDVEYIAADGRPEHTARIRASTSSASRRGGGGPVVHLNGHFDVVPAGDGWTRRSVRRRGARRPDLRPRRRAT